MKNEVFKTTNGLTMVKSKLFNWVRDHENYNKSSPYFYNIHLGGFSGGHNCNYSDENKTLTITCTTFEDSNDPSLVFKVNSIEDADVFVDAFIKGMGMYYSVNGTIYKGNKFRI